MWDCKECGTKAIAGDLDACPHCKRPQAAAKPEASSTKAEEKPKEEAQPGKAGK